MDWHWQGFQHEELFDLASLDTLHAPAMIDVRQNQPAGCLFEVDPRRDYPLARSRSQRTGFMALHADLDKLSRQPINLVCLAAAVHHQQPCTLGHKETIFRERIRVTVIFCFADEPGGRLFIRAYLGCDNRYLAVVFLSAVSGREHCHNLFCSADGLGIYHYDAGVHISVVNHLSGPVGIGRPEVVVVHLAAVDVLPPLI
ncbi:hypothetical protein ES703_84238 [subsurface metagenome]